MTDTDKRLLKEHQKLKKNSSIMLLGLLVFAAVYLLFDAWWIMIPGGLYLAVVYILIQKGKKAVAQAYQKEEEGVLEELKGMVSETKDGNVLPLVCGYLERAGKKTPCLLWRDHQDMRVIDDLFIRQKIYEVSGQAMYILMLKPKKERAAYAFESGTGSWKKLSCSHLNYLTRWAEQEQNYSCLEHFANDRVLEGLLQKKPQMVGFAAERSRLKRQTMREWDTESGIQLILTEEQRKRLNLKAGKEEL